MHGREAYARREASPLGQRYPLGNPLGQRLYKSGATLTRFPRLRNAHQEKSKVTHPQPLLGGEQEGKSKVKSFEVKVGWAILINQYFIELQPRLAHLTRLAITQMHYR